MKEINEIIEKSLLKLEKWIEAHDYKGYEPFDGLSSYLRHLTFGNLFAERVLQQLVRQCPINLRPFLGIKPLESTKGRGYMACGYLKMLKLTSDQRYKKKAIKCLEWLEDNKSPYYSDFSWGNHFPFSGRGGHIPKYESLIVWTSIIGQTFLDAYEILNDNKYLNIAASICNWILDLPRERVDSSICLSYVSYFQSSIHNSNMLGAAMLARFTKFTNNTEVLKVAKQAMKYSCSRQRSDGSWYYGETSQNHWIDNFHTGYNLDSLKYYIDNTNDKSFEKNLKQGFEYFKNTFFEKNGRPKYYHNRTYPVDIQCASQAIDTLAYFSEYDESSLELSLKITKWTIDNMQDQKGYFYYRQLPYMKVKIPMLHWGQATMYKALTHLLLKLSIIK